MPDRGDLKRTILEKAHSSKFSVYLGSAKMHQDLKQLFWWEGIKRDIGNFVSRCLVCQQVKVEHQRPTGLHQQIELNGNGKELQ